MSGIKPAAVPPKKKLTKKQQEEEDERLAKEAADAAAAALAAIPPSPFDHIEEVWALDGQFAQQRQLVGQIFDVEDGPGICIQALTLDDVYSHIHFARTAGLNNEQTKAFFAIMQALKAQLADSNCTMETAFQSFKSAVMANSAIVRGRPNQPQPAPTAAAAAASVPSIALSVPASGNGRPGSSASSRPLSSKGAPGAEQPRPSSRGGVASKGSNSPVSSSRNSLTAGSKVSGVTPRGAAAAAAAAAAAEESAAADAAALTPPPPAVPKQFSLENIKQITEYVTQGYFQHYRLYQACFNPKLFRPRTNVVVERLLVETYVPDRYASLDAAVELGAHRQRLQQQQQQRILQQQQMQQLQQQQQEESKRKETEESKEQWADDGASTGAQSRTGTAPGANPSRPMSPLDAEAALADDDDIGLLVRQHMRKARAQMLALIHDNEKTLDAKLRSIEAKVGLAPGAAPGSAAGAAAKSSASTKKR